jgi:hypothetical protein
MAVGARARAASGFISISSRGWFIAAISRSRISRAGTNGGQPQIDGLPPSAFRY